MFKFLTIKTRKELGKAFITMFYLTIIAVGVTYTLSNNVDVFFLFPYFVWALISLSIGLYLYNDADIEEIKEKKKIGSISEIKKGVFHVQNAEIVTK